jgi:hypothetical protein
MELDDGRTEQAGPSPRTRGGTSYQHSLSARGIKSSGRARSCSDEDLLSSLERLERASRRGGLEEESRGPRGWRAFGRNAGGRGSSASDAAGERRVRGPRFDW